MCIHVYVGSLCLHNVSRVRFKRLYIRVGSIKSNLHYDSGISAG